MAAWAALASPDCRGSRQESGQSLVEALTAFVILLIAGTGLVQILISSTNARGYSFQQTRAEEVAQAAIEQIRNLPYQNVGTVNGNPSGTWAASQAPTRRDARLHGLYGHGRDLDQVRRRPGSR